MGLVYGLIGLGLCTMAVIAALDLHDASVYANGKADGQRIERLACNKEREHAEKQAESDFKARAEQLRDAANKAREQDQRALDAAEDAAQDLELELAKLDKGHIAWPAAVAKRLR